MSTLKMVLHVQKILKITIQKNLSKFQEFAMKIFLVELLYNQTIFFLRFTVILLTILKLMILWNFILEFYLRYWSLLKLSCTHCILISVSLNLLYSNRLTKFNDVFQYFCEGKIPKINICAGLNYLFIHYNDYESF